MVLFYYDPVFLRHETEHHPECADRVARTFSHLERVKLTDQLHAATWESATLDELQSVHHADQIRVVDALASQGGGMIDSDTIVSLESAHVARRATGAVVHAVGKVLTGDDRRAFCLVRPPGHHATSDTSMGFCLFNSIAVAAMTAIRKYDVSRVLIVDWDVHHGNGTQDIFWTSSQVGFVSIHRYPFYPGSGSRDETGAGAGQGTTLNLPIALGTSREDYISAFQSGLEQMCQKLRPELILLSAGFDGHRLDPIGSLGLETEDFAELTKILSDVANVHAKGRLVSVLEGGYNLEVLPLCVEQHIRHL